MIGNGADLEARMLAEFGRVHTRLDQINDKLLHDHERIGELETFRVRMDSYNEASSTNLDLLVTQMRSLSTTVGALHDSVSKLNERDWAERDRYSERARSIRERLMKVQYQVWLLRAVWLLGGGGAGAAIHKLLGGGE